MENTKTYGPTRFLLAALDEIQYADRVNFSAQGVDLAVRTAKQALALFQLQSEGKACPECAKRFDKPLDEADDVAIHLLDAHGWDYEHARIWLRDRVEEKLFKVQP